jgi:endonuclease/exonuclease/phosphatase family metal-dependent hydrolase
MDVMTLNIWGTRGPLERQRVLIDAIRALAPEILCLQEATDPRIFPHFSYTTRLHASIGGLAILSVYPAISRRTFSYQTLSPLEPHPRQLLLAQLESPQGPLWVATTHLSWKAEDEPSRLGQVEELLTQAQSLEGNLLLCGDFNAEPPSPPIRRVVEAGFVDLFARLHSKEPGITWDNRNPFIQSHEVRFPDRRIDYLFARTHVLDSLNLKSCEVACRTPDPQGLYPSDHYGVMAAFADKPIGR